MNILLIVVCSLLMIIGVVGIILPFLPGTLLVFLGLLLYAIFSKFTTITVTTIIILAILTILAQIFDYLSQSLTAKKFGASQYGFWGGIIGLIIGLVFSPFGLISIIIMPFLGIIIGEIVAGKKLLHSGKIGLGSLLGYFCSLLFNILVASIIIFFFLQTVF